MKTLSITIEDGRITGYEGTEVNQDWRPDFISGNGWSCVVTHDGIIRCTASQKYLDGRHTMTFEIIPGKVRTLILETPSIIGRKRIKEVKMKDTSINGVIVLGDGRIDHRDVYFQSK